MLVDRCSSIYITMNMKSGIDNALLRTADSLLQSFMKHDDRAGFFKQADMEQGLLFAIRARGSEERWRAQGHDISGVSFKIRVSRPRPTLARNRWKAPRDHTPSSLKDVQKW